MSTSITTIQSTDLITNSRADINNNFDSLLVNKLETSVLDTDTTLAANSDEKVPTQKAVKAYVDAGGNVNASETVKGIVEEATDAQVASGTAVGETGAKLFVTPAKLATRIATNIQEFTSSGTWTKPSLGNYAIVEIIGAGGSGGTAKQGGNPVSAQGGSGGAYRQFIIPLSFLSETETVTIGTGGTAVVNSTTSTNVNGNPGGVSWFKSTLFQANGGLGGGSNRTGTLASAIAGGTRATDLTTEKGADSGTVDGAANTCSVGESSLYAGAGGGGAHADGAASPTSVGGTSLFTASTGGEGAATNGTDGATATAGTRGGGGGGAVVSNATGTATSGAGGNGYVRVTVI